MLFIGEEVLVFYTSCIGNCFLTQKIYIFSKFLIKNVKKNKNILSNNWKDGNWERERERA